MRQIVSLSLVERDKLPLLGYRSSKSKLTFALALRRALLRSSACRSSVRSRKSTLNAYQSRLERTGSASSSNIESRGR